MHSTFTRSSPARHPAPHPGRRFQSPIACAQIAVAAGLALCGGAALAAPSCGMQATQLLADGKITELAERFEGHGPETRNQLADLARAAGTLSRLAPSAKPLQGKHQRTSVLAPGLPAKYTFNGEWISAQSARLGRVQIQASIKQGSACRLLALHLDIPQQP